MRRFFPAEMRRDIFLVEGVRGADVDDVYFWIWVDGIIGCVYF
jgi:hypothetical protein